MAQADRSPQRVIAMRQELNKRGAEFRDARERFEATRVSFEAARETLTGIRRLASKVLSDADCWVWKEQNPDIAYVGLSLGDAILRVLTNSAFSSAVVHHRTDGKTLYDPSMTLEDIVAELENGGFEFRTSGPLREVNAALIHLKDKEKHGERYRSSAAPKILDAAKSLAIERQLEELHESEPPF